MAENGISPATHIIVKGARQHNLKNVDLTLPKGKLIVFTGLSGSGKSSLAFDTIYAEGQRKYVESLSSYARQFLGIMQKPDVDQIEGLSPAISIDQKTTSHNPRSTVGTITEIYDYLRLLFARIGHPHCPECGSEIAPQSTDQIAIQMAERIIEASKAKRQSRWFILSPVVRDKKGEFAGLFDNLRQKGFQRVRVDGLVYDLDEDFVLLKTNRHSIGVAVDRISFSLKDTKDPEKVEVLKHRIRQSVEAATDLAEGLVILTEILDADLDFPTKPKQFEDHLYSQKLACPQCNISIGEIEPRMFSFNTPHGACPRCTGLGSLLKISPEKVVAPDLTISEGAIIPLAGSLSADTWMARKLKAVLEDYGQSIMTAYKDLPDTVKQVILYGDRRIHRTEGTNRQGRYASFTFEHEGVINELERRYQESSSEYVRGEIERYMHRQICPECQGKRLTDEALSVTITGKNIFEVTDVAIDRARDWIGQLEASIKNPNNQILSPAEKQIAQSIVRELCLRLDFLTSVGLEYLTLNREAATLAGGEAQRIRLASQIGTGLTGVLYVLDEPTIGLHPRDNDRLIRTLTSLRDLANTVVVVEHDEHVIRSADYVVDFGPGAGERGGEVVTAGSIEAVINDKESLTAQYLRGDKRVDESALRQQSGKLHAALRQANPLKPEKDKKLSLTGASEHNLKHISVDFPLGQLVVVTGVSGSGKSSLIHDTLFPALKMALDLKTDHVGKYDSLKGSEVVTKAYLIDQSPIGRTPRSNPATYTKAFDHIRQIFAQTKEAKAMGYKPGRFSFNVKGGRCEACQGDGQVKISMQFLADVYVTCDVCQGKRYNAASLAIKYRGLSIADVLDLTVDQALKLFQNHSGLTKRIATLQAVGLGYLRLGQPAPTLSGGEAQRVKLAKELSVNSPGHTVYLLDEPTTGLHFEDVKNLMIVLRQLKNNNNTVIVIEHNLDVVRNADWVIDLGPEGGDRGGEVVAVGTPEDIARAKNSYTGGYLKDLLNT